MTPAHPRWLEFCIAMQKLDPDGGCNHDHDFTAQVLGAMGENVEDSLAYFRANGGHCACEVIFNVVLPSLDNLNN